ncbi:MAG: hypothetical protein HY554_19125 [Elusimicrobia bacterium]|nr:hypothetical protein [Elusimicrobiota bacterium]
MKRTFKIAMSERCYRFKPEALDNHAPKSPGVYEFVTFDAQLKPEVLYVGVSTPQTLYEALAAHLMGSRRPTGDDLFRAAKDVYFDFVASSDAASPEDLQDIAASLAARAKPRLNGASGPGYTGRYEAVEVSEAG